MYLFSLLGGFFNKIYDDLNDNKLLQKFRNDTFLEFLKGTHFILFTTVSIEEPVFFIILYIANVLNYFGNNYAFSESYEYSLFYSFMLLFFIIDYKKMTNICVSDILLMVSASLTHFIEPIIMKYFFKDSEFSFEKMILRSITLIGVVIYFLFTTSRPIKFLLSYYIGYFLFSVLVQCYSLISINYAKQEKIKEKEEEEAKEEEQAKEKEKAKEETKEKEKAKEETKEKEKAKEEIKEKEKAKEETKEKEKAKEETKEKGETV